MVAEIEAEPGDCPSAAGDLKQTNAASEAPVGPCGKEGALRGDREHRAQPDLGGGSMGWGAMAPSCPPARPRCLTWRMGAPGPCEERGGREC